MTSSLTILSYNIHKGVSALKTRSVLKSIREALQELSVDIVFLQEVTGHNVQFEYLAHEIWPHHVYGRNAVFRNGEHQGNAILSRYPIVAFENVDITRNRFEKRGILHAQIDIPGFKRPLHCFNIHLNLLHRDRIKQIKTTTARLKKLLPEHEPMILAGDFNDWSARLSSVLKKEIGVEELFKITKGAHPTTFPSGFPFLRLDRIYIRGLMPESAEVLSGMPWKKLSDHLPIVGVVSGESKR